MSLPISMPKFSQGIARGILTAAVLMPIAVNAAAGDSAVVDDFESGTNQNKFLAYTFYYNDSKDGGNTVIASAKASGAELLYDAALSVGEGAGGSAKALKLEFTFGSVKPKGCGGTCAYGNMAGMGTGFVADGQVLNMTGATAISFWAKASANMAMRVEIATEGVKDFGYHMNAPQLTPTWTKITIPLIEGPDLQQPTWAEEVPFDLTKMQKIQFAISADDNPSTLTGGTVYIDDIVVHGYKWVPPSACITCVGLVGTGGLLSDMETAPKNQNKSGGYWYAYNDTEGRIPAPVTQSEYSEIYEGVTIDEITKIPTLAISTGKGAANSSGAYIAFNLGPTYTQGTSTIRPFVGIGTKVSDALGNAFSNYTGSTGVSFSYWTSATSTMSYIRLEVKAKQTAAAFANAGIVHHVLLPVTGGVWKDAVVKWTDLKLPDWDEVKLIPIAQQALNVAQMDKFQWAVQDEPGVEGAIAVDNVKIEGLATVPAFDPNASIRGGFGTRGQGFSLTQGLRKLQVAVNLGDLAQTGEVRLLNLKGEVVGKAQVAGTGMKTAELSTLNLRSGVYAVQVKVGDHAMTAPVTVLP